MAKPRFEVWRGKDKKYYFHFKAANNKIMFPSEGYRFRWGAKRGIRRLKDTVIFADVIDVDR